MELFNSRHIVSQILSNQGQEERIENIHAHLTKVKEDLEAGKASNVISLYYIELL